MEHFYLNARAKMVTNQLMPDSVTDEHLLHAMAEVPREKFVEEKWQTVAYSDARIPQDEKRYLLSPSLFARMAQTAEITKNDKVLDIASGTCYSSIIFSKIAKEVVSLDCIKSLSMKGASLIKELAPSQHISLKISDLFSGAPEQAPFDVIFLNGAVDRTPESLLIQLKNGGRLISIEPEGKILYVVKYTNFAGKYNKQKLFETSAEFL